MRGACGTWESAERVLRSPGTGSFRMPVIQTQSPRRHGGPPLRLANCYVVLKRVFLDDGEKCGLHDAYIFASGYSPPAISLSVSTWRCGSTSQKFPSK